MMMVKLWLHDYVSNAERPWYAVDYLALSLGYSLPLEYLASGEDPRDLINVYLQTLSHAVGSLGDVLTAS
jgi:hypothetical protein